MATVVLGWYFILLKGVVHDKLSIETAVNYLQLKCDKASNDYII